MRRYMPRAVAARAETGELNGLYAAWTASLPETVLDGAAATVTNYAGNVSSISGQNGNVTVSVSLPVFIQVSFAARRRAAKR